jgi:YHS domain-containing protein
MDVVPGQAAGGSVDHAGTTYWFCGEGGRRTFRAEPDDRICTCPMHPQIRQRGPGSCPICGMAPEPVTVTADEGPDPELVEMTRRSSVPASESRWTGVVVEGVSARDESMIMGEPIPVEKVAGSRVIGGTVNATSGFLMRAERVGSETLLARIVQMVSEAQRSRAPSTRSRARRIGSAPTADGRHGGGRRERWPGAGPGQRGHRDGHRDRRRDRERRRDAREGRSAGLVRARHVSRATMRNTRENLFLAFVYNALGVPLAARRALSVVRCTVEPDHRERRHDVQLGVRDRECASTTPAVPVRPGRATR